MSWFTKICRDVGLMIHNVRHPHAGKKTVVRRDVQEENRGDVTLRRTTIDEIEIKQPTDSHK